MKSIKNKTHAPIRVPLPQGKILHLGPLKTGQIADHAVDHAKVQELIKAGSIEVVEEAAKGGAAGAGDSSVHASTHGMGPNTRVTKAGDR